MKYKVIGYGSLISHKSLKETIHDRKFEPVIVKGYKRIFNLAVNPKENYDVLNLEKDKKAEFNGVLFKVNEEELKKIKLREVEYNLEESEAYDFKTKKPLGKSFIVIDYTVNIDKNHKNPSKKYFILCREAAYHISQQFGEMWDKTTYISDNELVLDWLKNHPEYNTIKN
jgi:cation transport regulator ChaC